MQINKRAFTKQDHDEVTNKNVFPSHYVKSGMGLTSPEKKINTSHDLKPRFFFKKNLDQSYMCEYDHNFDLCIWSSKKL